MKVLVAEDEKEMQYAIRQFLELMEIQVDSAYDGQQAMDMATAGAYDCMVFDIMMPRVDGVTVVQRLRSAGNVTPIIMLTAKAEVDDRIVGLDAGADDYLTKPFAMKELLARIKSQVRRQDSYTSTRLELGNVILDVEQQELAARNTIRLAKKETSLLEYLMLNEGKPLSTEDIHGHVWKDDPQMEQEVVWVYISYLRQKLQSVEADLHIAGEQNGSFTLCRKA